MRSDLLSRRILLSSYAAARRLGKRPTALVLGHPWARFSQAPATRGAKTKATVRLEDIPDVHPPKSQQPAKVEDGPKYPTVLQQVRENMLKHEKCVLLTRVGNFYELYFEHAEKYGPLLNLKVSSKRTASAGDVAIAGFPYYQLDRFLKILVQDLNEYVAISDEFANDAVSMVKSGGLLFDRRVARVISPGTLVDEKFLDPYENNYLLAICSDAAGGTKSESEPHQCNTIMEGSETKAASSLAEKRIGLAWLDLSTGDFFTQTTTLALLSNVAARIRPKEIVMVDAARMGSDASAGDMLEKQNHFITFHDFNLESSSIDSWRPMLEREIEEDALLKFTPEEVVSGTLLLSYVQQRLQTSSIKLQPPVRRQDKETMSIDKNSMKALEIQGTSKEGSAWGKGSLLHTLRRTVTKSGARLLRDWICSPSMSLDIINGRLDLVSHLLKSSSLRAEIVTFLKQSHDSQRLTQKFSMGRGDADDLLSLLRTIDVTQDIAKVLERETLRCDLHKDDNSGFVQQKRSLVELHSRLILDGPVALADMIRHAIDEDALLQSQRIQEDENSSVVAMAQELQQDSISMEGQSTVAPARKTKSRPKGKYDSDSEDQEPWILRRSANGVLQALHEALEQLQVDKIDLETRLRRELQAPSLTLRWTPGLGHICHIKGSRDISQSSKTQLLKATKSTRSCHHPQWSSLGGKLDQAKLRIRAEEKRLLQSLRAQVILNLVKLRENATVLDRLDIGCAFATLAKEQGLIRPVLSNGLDLNIVNGRHPTVEIGLEEQGRAFVSNDCHIGNKERIWLITGPNMAGKSTFLRQNALITILAQAGAFVPADHAEIGLVDQIFTRVGSADDLFRDQSTFMVEMMETAAILNNATPQSLVIMDEIGRGTTPEDGIAIGFACLHHLYHKNQCRALFATHFHSLADMTKHLKHVGCYCTDIAEGKGGTFAFVHRLRPGVNRSSHALKVAALAGVPKAAIDTARSMLESIQRESEVSVSGASQQVAKE